LEGAYRETLELVGKSTATRLIDVGIKLDHLMGFPLEDVRELHKDLAKNPFADTILADLVTAHMTVFEVDRRIRQTMASIFKFGANAPSLMDPNRKKM
jgi:CheY-like chemotaxis protein